MTSTSDPMAAFAAELARLGHRLDSVEARLETLGGTATGPDAVTGVVALPTGPGAAPGSPVPASSGGPWPVPGSSGPAAPGPAAPGPGAPGPGVPGPGAPGGSPRPWWMGSDPAPADGAPPHDPAPGRGQSAPAAGPPPPGAPWGPAAPWGPPGPGGPPGVGLPIGWSPPLPAPPKPVLPKVSMSGPRLLAWTGGAMTLLGVVLFLALAASRGWGTPPVRVAAGAVFGAVLIGFAIWMHRVETRRGGALALAGTGFAALYLVVAAMNRLLDVPGPLALLLALLVAGAGIALAERWRSALLASGIVVGAAMLAPVLVQGPLLVALVLVLQVAVTPVALHLGPRHSGWSWPLVLAAVCSSLAAVGVSFLDDPLRVLAVLAVMLVGLTAAAVAVGRAPQSTIVWLVASASLPPLVLGPELDGWGGAGISAAAALLVLALLAVPGGTLVLRRVVVAVAAVGVLEAVLIVLEGPVATGTLLGIAIAAAATAVAVRDRLTYAVAGGFAVIAVLRAISLDAPLTALAVFPADPWVVAGQARPAALVGGLVVSLLVLLAAVALTVAAGRLGLARPDSSSAGIWVPLGIAGLYGTTGMAIALALLVSADRTAFTVGHAVVTVTWTVIALVLLARGLRRPALRVTGLVLVGGAVAKLVLFDLVALDGLIRVAAFLGAGLVLLAAGTRYARMVAEAG